MAHIKRCSCSGRRRWVATAKNSTMCVAMLYRLKLSRPGSLPKMLTSCTGESRADRT